MASIHTKRIEFDAISSDPLMLYRALDQIAQQSLRKAGPPGKKLETHSLIKTREGVEVRCSTFDEAHAEIREEALTPDEFHSLMRVGMVGPYQIHIIFTPANARIRVRFSNKEAGANEAVAARMEREVESARRHAGSGRLPADEPMTLENTATPEATTTPPTRESGTEWLKRTWRDHTTTLVITVAGGLVVVAVAVWLGLQSA